MLKLLRTPFTLFLRPQVRRTARPSGEPEPGQPLTPEAASGLAAVAVQVAALAHGVELDYSPASLDRVERLILQLGAGEAGEAGEGSAHEPRDKWLLVFGCYAGEVLVRHLNFSWDVATPTERGLSGARFGLRAPNGGFWNPIGKLHRLAADPGGDDGIASMYRMARHTAARPIPAAP